MRALALAALLGVAPLVWAQELRSATLYAARISCDACAAVITKTLRNVPGVGKVSVDVDRKEIHVQFDPARVKIEDLTAATAKRGYDSSVVGSKR